MNRRTLFKALAGGFVALKSGLPQVLAEAPPITATIEAIPAALAAVETFSAGDVVTFAGVFNVNPRTLKPTQNLKQFCVTAMIDGKPIIYPQPITEGPYRNVSQKPNGKATPRMVGIPCAPMNINVEYLAPIYRQPSK